MSGAVARPPEDSIHIMGPLGRNENYLDLMNQNVEREAQDLSQPRQSNKRKRDSPGLSGRNTRQGTLQDKEQQHNEKSPKPSQRPYYPQQNGNEEYSIQHQVARHVANANASSTTAAAALAASMPQLSVPQATELSFPSTNSGNEEDRQLESSFDMGPESSQQHAEGGPYNLSPYTGVDGDQGQNITGPNTGKPAVGTEEWHKVRKDNHKEVERRRRETINEGINELAKIVPGCDKNKGAILQRGVQYITTLKDNEARNIEKWTLEKMLTDQAIQELTLSVDKLKDELAKARNDADRWKDQCKAAGVEIDAETSDTGGGR